MPMAFLLTKVSILILLEGVPESNYSGADWLDALLNNTELTVIFKGGATGEFKYELKAYVTSWKVSANHNDLSKYDVSFRANSITRTTLS